MNKQFERLEYLIGCDKINNLQHSTVAIIGLGGVGAVAAEVLARSGIGHLIIQDYDKVEITNINRQIIANHNTIGSLKCDILESELKQINPNIKITKLPFMFNNETKELLFKETIDFVIDAIDSIEYKYLLINELLIRDINFISSMGAAKKMSPFNILIDDINKTSHDPIAKIIRKRLRDDNINKQFKVVFSKEQPMNITKLGSYMPVTASFGIVCAHYAITELMKGGLKNDIK